MRYSLVAGMLGTCFWIGTTLVGSAAAAADDALDNTLDNAVEKVMRDSFTGASPEHWKSRLEQDEVQAFCSRFRNRPPPDVVERIVELSNSNFRYPADGKLLGDWVNGEKLASSGERRAHWHHPARSAWTQTRCQLLRLPRVGALGIVRRQSRSQSD